MDPEDQLTLNALIAAGRSRPPSPQLPDPRVDLADALMRYGTPDAYPAPRPNP